MSEKRRGGEEGEGEEKGEMMRRRRRGDARGKHAVGHTGVDGRTS